MIRFTIEERHLTDGEGRPVTSPEAVAFHTIEAETVDDAVRLYIGNDGTQLIGDVLKFPGLQAMATIRKASGVYTLQLTPASQGYQL